MAVEQWGAWAFFLSILSIVLLVSDFGINLSSKKFIAQYQHAPELFSVLRQSLLLRLVASVLFAVILWAGQRPLVNLIGRPELASLLVVLPWIALFYSVLEYFKTCSEGFHRLRFHFTLVSIEHWGKLFVLSSLFVVCRSLDSLALGLAFVYGAGALGGGFLFRKRFFPSGEQRESFRLWPRMLEYSLPMLIMVLIAFGTMEVDTLMLNYMQGDYETGIYAAARQLVFYIPHLTLALTMGTMPVFARMPEGEAEEYRRRFVRIQRISSGAVLTILLGIGAVSPFLLPFLYGPEYRASVLPLLCLLPYTFFISHGLCSGALLDYRGKANRRAINLGVTFVANLALNFLLIPRYGATGAAIATSAAFFPYFLLNLIYARREFKMAENVSA